MISAKVRGIRSSNVNESKGMEQMQLFNVK